LSRRARKGRNLDGILVIDKPAGRTSNAILQQVKRRLGAAKAGHTGSLDPLATGVLPLCFGEATKFSQWLLDADKAYRAEGRLGIITDSGDSDGQVLETRPLPQGLDRAALERALAPLRGEIDQVPPMYSALKHQGQPLYKLARQGKEVERKARRVQIRELTLISFSGDRFEIDVRCSKGTYIRSLVESIGETLGCGAHVTALRRTGAASFTLADAVPMDELEREVPPEYFDPLLLPIDRPLEDLPAVCINAEHCVSILNGQPVRIPGQSKPGQVRLYRSGASAEDADTGSVPSQQFLGLGEVMLDGQVKPRRLVNTARTANKDGKL
jgi:tRNA pseudouridine55 synthase